MKKLLDIIRSHRLLSWLDSSGASFLCRGEVEEVSFVGEGEALDEESLPPPSDPDGTEERWGTGGALFLPRKPPSSTPLFLTPPSAFTPSPTDPTLSPSSGCWCFLLTSPPGIGLSGGCRGDSVPPSAFTPEQPAVDVAPMFVAKLKLAVRQAQNSIAEALLSLSSGPKSQSERRASGAWLGPCVEVWLVLSRTPRLRLKFWKSLWKDRWTGSVTGG